MGKMFELHPVIIIRGIMYKIPVELFDGSGFVFVFSLVHLHSTYTLLHTKNVHCLAVARTVHLLLSFEHLIFPICAALSYSFGRFLCACCKRWGCNNKSKRGRSCRRRVPFNSPLSFICLMLLFFLCILFHINAVFDFGKSQTFNYELLES